MPRHRFMPAVLAAFALSAALSAAAAPAGAPADRTVIVPASEMRFYKSKEGLTVANGWGDPAHGAHSNFIRMDGNTASPPHTHTASYYGVVISGVVANEPMASTADHPLPAGSYWYQKGGEPHVTKCISPDACLIFVTSRASFDFHVVK
ncbi:DUF4437 domain-containing protein [Cupriavidus sp. 30B13]|uniref:DUF4437 domain-containing protein n=1 Tax=Cupriavidus sp. 30B13 TaxID=3384241 RepID=UPI003B9047ED